MKTAITTTASHHFHLPATVHSASNHRTVAEPTITVVTAPDGLSAFVIETPRQLVPNRF